MAAKRGAGSELNDRNWNDEEEPEEAGVFAQAPAEIMQQRVIKKAKRITGGQNNSSSGGVFSGFGGLSKKSENPPSTGSLFGAKPMSFGGASSESTNGGDKDKSSTDAKETKYFQSLKSLNESVLAWVKQHVEANPYIVLTPVFKDYEDYIKTLEAKRSTSTSGSLISSKKDPITTKTTFASIPEETGNNGNKVEDKSSKQEDKPFAFGSTSMEPSKGFTFGTSSNSTTNGGFKFSTTSATSGFTFGSKTETPTTSEEKDSFSFGKTDSKAADDKKPFSFGKTESGDDKKPFSFGLTSSSQGSGFSFGSSVAGSSQGSSQNDEEYVPPKVEVKEIKEDDALYSKRCKLYYQKEGAWVDRGVGNLHLKPIGDTKTQILIRADTNLGNILLNVMLTASFPASRQGKNNVTVVCVPNPPMSSKPEEASDKPVPMLIRVKTGEDADELLEKIDERKKILE